MIGLEDFYQNRSALWGLFILYFTLLLISHRHIMVGFQVFCKSLSVSRSWFQRLAMKKEEEEKGREGKGNHWRQLHVGPPVESGQKQGQSCLVRHIFSLYETKVTYEHIAEVTFVLFLLSPLLMFTFPFFVSSSLFQLGHLWLHLVFYSFSLLKSNLLAVIQRTSDLLRHYPETPKLLQTLPAPELK